MPSQWGSWLFLAEGSNPTAPWSSGLSCQPSHQDLPELTSQPQTPLACMEESAFPSLCTTQSSGSRTALPGGHVSLKVHVKVNSISCAYSALPSLQSLGIPCRQGRLPGPCMSLAPSTVRSSSPGFAKYQLLLLNNGTHCLRSPFLHSASSIELPKK